MTWRLGTDVVERVPQVAVVIPSVGRPELARALRSCASQVTQTVVVLDDPSRLQAVEALVRGAVPDAEVTIELTQGVGGGAARARGLALCDTQYVAFLDDDDAWEPDRIKASLPFLLPGSEQFLTSAAYFHFRGGEVRTMPSVATPSDPRAALSLALQQRHLRYNEGFLQSSTFLVSRSLAERHNWHPGLRKHQDWDFFARSTADPRCVWTHDPTPRVHVYQGTPGSVSRKALWRASFDWLNATPGLTPRARADFAAGEILRAGLQSRDRSAVAAALRLMTSARRPPHLASLIVGLSGALGPGDSRR
jgi:glycosyltransferase involved in cell wall biosynthesis